MEDFFYKVLEERGNISIGVKAHLIECYSEKEWAQKLIAGIENDEVHMFMQLSHQAMLTMLDIEKELQTLIIFQDGMIEQVTLYAHMCTKYLQ